MYSSWKLTMPTRYSTRRHADVNNLFFFTKYVPGKIHNEKTFLYITVHLNMIHQIQQYGGCCCFVMCWCITFVWSYLASAAWWCDHYTGPCEWTLPNNLTQICMAPLYIWWILPHITYANVSLSDTYLYRSLRFGVPQIWKREQDV